MCTRLKQRNFQFLARDLGQNINLKTDNSIASLPGDRQGCLQTSTNGENLDLSIIESFNAIGERSSLVSEPIIEQKSVMFYPNPAKKVVNISNTQTIASLTVYNSLGELIYTTNKVSEILPIPNWQVGLYFFDVETRYNTRTLVKFIKIE